MSGLREYLAQNMFDGVEGGEVTMKVTRLLDDVVDCVALFVLGNDTDRMETYFRGPQT